MDIKTIRKEAKKEINSAQNLKDLDDVYKKYLGKKGEITQILRSLKDLPERQRKKQGKLTNQVKKEIELAIKTQNKKLQVRNYNFQDEELDITIPSKKPLVGHFHPITIVRRKVEEIFQQMGFSIVEGPEVETEWYSFDALNIPKDHPARDVWDTLWLKPKSQNLLLRPHTSPVQIRYMEKNQPPLRIIAPGKVFRHEATDASHDVQFYHFKAIIQEFFKRFFNKDIKIRLRPSFFPFTEPSFEMDISCVNCQGKGCSVCKQTGWVETLGAGMVHPNVLKAGGINPKFWQGFAFGIGLDRLAMMKYKINDIRLFYSSDFRFLEQF